MNNIQEILSIDVDNLKDKQYKALKNHVTDVLNKFLHNLENDDLKACFDMLDYSPAGDGYGCDNNFIDFKWESAPDVRDGYDIGVLLDMLAKLKGVKIDE